MIPIVDMHCHLLAGLDDGPREPDEALAMCRKLVEEGASSALALAHQNEFYPNVTPEKIREAFPELKERLRSANIPLAVFPGAEIMIQPMLLEAWQAGQLVSIADGGKYLLIEFPHGLFIDLRELVADLAQRGIRPILAHPEQTPELLFSPFLAEELVRLGCLFQLSSGNVTGPADKRMAKTIKTWLRQGWYHVIGSDAHGAHRRPPLLAEASRVIAQWAGPAIADRVCGMNALAILQGLPLPRPAPAIRGNLFSRAKSWLLGKGLAL